MHRTALPHIFDLRDAVPEPDAQDSFFRDLDQRLSECALRLAHFKQIEQELVGLDRDAWAHLKSEVIKDGLAKKGAKRGWSQLHERFNEAKGYNYLKRRGSAAVSFIPRAKDKTPDLQAEGGRVLCEVKTINISDREVNRRAFGGIIDVTRSLNTLFFTKLDKILASAKAQLTQHNPDPSVTRIVYVVINFDDLLHEYAQDYKMQIDQHMQSHLNDSVEVVFYWKLFCVAQS